MAYLSVKVRDFSDEYSIFSFPVSDYPGAETISTIESEAGGLETILDALMLGTIVSISVSQVAEEGADTRPASGEAQREKGFRFFYSDDVTNRKGSVTVPTADFGSYAQPGTDLLDLSDTDIAALVTWIEANVTIGGNAVTVNRGVLVGRNS